MKKYYHDVSKVKNIFAAISFYISILLRRTKRQTSRKVIGLKSFSQTISQGFVPRNVFPMTFFFFEPSAACSRVQSSINYYVLSVNYMVYDTYNNLFFPFISSTHSIYDVTSTVFRGILNSIVLAKSDCATRCGVFRYETVQQCQYLER